MLKRIVNEASFRVQITTTGPLLIRSGIATVSGPDMTPVRTFRNGKWEVYIPGSSLKGVIRSHAEKIIRTLKQDVCCDPFAKASQPNASCGEIIGARNPRSTDEKLSPEESYAASCPACRLFGSTAFIGRISIGDAYVQGDWRLEQRDGVGIDRFTSGPANTAKFTLEAVSSGVIFHADVLLRNYECWQLGLFLAVIQDLRDGLVRVGGGKSRGFGAVTANLGAIRLFHFGAGQEGDSGTVRGLGNVLGDRSYHTAPDDVIEANPPMRWARRGLRLEAEVSEAILPGVEAAAIKELVRRMDSWPERKQGAHLGGGGRR